VAELQLERAFPVAPSVVWSFLSDPELVVRWWGPHGFTNVVDRWDLRPGGAYRITMQPPDGDEFHLRGEFEEVIPDERLAYTFVWEEPHPDDVPARVTITLRGGNDATALTVDHGPFEKEERVAPPRGGWTEGLEKLASLIDAAP
jgi:uncharacterized protein YndB with AHSA1/START domain